MWPLKLQDSDSTAVNACNLVRLGCRAKKTGKPPADFLRFFARSSHLASLHAGGLLEPLYALHAARLKLLDAQLATRTGAAALHQACRAVVVESS